MSQFVVKDAYISNKLPWTVYSIPNVRNYIQYTWVHKFPSMVYVRLKLKTFIITNKYLLFLHNQFFTYSVYNIVIIFITKRCINLFIYEEEALMHNKHIIQKLACIIVN